MSFQRAYAACKNCDVYRSRVNTNPGQWTAFQLLMDNSRYEAMRALEETASTNGKRQSLIDCSHCKGTTTHIANYAAEIVPELKKKGDKPKANKPE